MTLVHGTTNESFHLPLSLWVREALYCPAVKRKIVISSRKVMQLSLKMNKRNSIAVSSSRHCRVPSPLCQFGDVLFVQKPFSQSKVPLSKTPDICSLCHHKRPSDDTLSRRKFPKLRNPQRWQQFQLTSLPIRGIIHRVGQHELRRPHVFRVLWHITAKHGCSEVSI
jgi:hypothetical protein